MTLRVTHPGRRWCKRGCWFGVLLVCVVIASVLHHYLWGSDRDALWRVIHEQCLSQPLATPSGRCQQVDMSKQYVVIKDLRGPYHDLLIPSYPITGLESRLLQQRDETHNLMAFAWDARERLANEAKVSIPDDYFSIAINSRWGRSQDQLHIHIACLKPDVYTAIARQADHLGMEWVLFPEPLQGSTYWVRRLHQSMWGSEDPILLLNEYLRQTGKSAGSFGLAVTRLADGDFLMLITGLDLLKLERGSAGALQDFTCAMARPG